MHTLTATPTPSPSPSPAPSQAPSPDPSDSAATTGSGNRSELTHVERLHALDHLLHGLWAHEPDARFGERHQRLDALRQLTIEVERLAFRQSFHPDEHQLACGGADRAALEDCTRRTADLLRNWSNDLWVGEVWPTNVLGERIAGGRS